MTCVGETKKSGANWPLTLTVVPASMVGKGSVVAISTFVASFVPKAAAMPSGDSSAVKLAALVPPAD